MRSHPLRTEQLCLLEHGLHRLVLQVRRITVFVQDALHHQANLCLRPFPQRLLGDDRVKRRIVSRKRPTSATSPKSLPLRRQFTRREVRPVPDGVAQFPELRQRGIFDDGFVEARLWLQGDWK